MDDNMAPEMLDHYRWMPRYNAWFNDRLHGASERLDDAARKADRGACFGSIHDTLNHLGVADQFWLKRLVRAGIEPGVTDLLALVDETSPALAPDALK